MSQWKEIGQRASGKWQLPLLLVSLGLLGVAVFRLTPAPTELPFGRALTYLDGLLDADMFDSAASFGASLQERDGLTPPERAGVRLRLARAVYGVAARERLHTRGVGRTIVDHYDAAIASGQNLTAVDYMRRGEALEWLTDYSLAAASYGEALTRQDLPDPLDLRRRLLALKIDHLSPPPSEADAMLDQFLDELDGPRPELRLWAVQRKLEAYEAMGRLDEGVTLLARHKKFLDTPRFRDRFVFLEAMLLYQGGSFDEAEVQLRALLQRVSRNDEVYAMAGWLLGTVVMNDGGPQRPLEALSFFTDVLSHHQSGPYAVASRVGSAEALAMLERHGQSQEAFRTAIDDLSKLGEQRVVDFDVLRATLSVLAESQRQEGHAGVAVKYAMLAASLIDPDNVEQATLLLQQLGRLQVQHAKALDRKLPRGPAVPGQLAEAFGADARAAFEKAADTYLHLAQLNALNERIAADASWQAAELYARAGQRNRAANLFRAFVNERPEHARVPRALLRIGQIHHAAGRLPEAVAAYQECYRRFPRTLDGARALVPLARCYLAMESDNDELAEKTLRIVLDDSEVFTPDAPEFSEALFLLGEALKRRNDFERAIATLEEALERYPDDPRSTRTRFLLADSYRQSGLALKGEIEKATSAAEIELMRDESNARFATAQRFFREMVDDYELRDPTSLDLLERSYLRLARLYEADCFFETQQYDKALKRYEEAAGTYRNTASAMAAYVQIINSHVFLGAPGEARAALARALVLVDSLPDEAFAASVSPERRADWKRYFEWLGQSGLF